MIDKKGQGTAPPHPRNGPFSEPAVTDDHVELRSQSSTRAETARVIAFHSPGDANCTDQELVQRMLAGDIRAKALFFDREGGHVRGILVRLLGPNVELADLTHDVFATAFKTLPKLKKADSLRAWLTSMTVFRARGYMRSRRRNRWLEFFSPDQIPERTAEHADPDTRHAVAAVFSILEELPPDDRIAFSLRFIAGMQIAEGASAVGVSATTFKRRVRRATELFESLAAKVPELQNWVEGNA